MYASQTKMFKKYGNFHSETIEQQLRYCHCRCFGGLQAQQLKAPPELPANFQPDDGCCWAHGGWTLLLAWKVQFDVFFFWEVEQFLRWLFWDWTWTYWYALWGWKEWIHHDQQKGYCIYIWYTSCISYWPGRVQMKAEGVNGKLYLLNCTNSTYDTQDAVRWYQWYLWPTERWICCFEYVIPWPYSNLGNLTGAEIMDELPVWSLHHIFVRP